MARRRVDIRHRILGGARGVVLRPLLLSAAAVLLAWLLLSLDHALRPDAPVLLGYDPGLARTLLAGFATALLSIAVLTLWMRSVVLQFISNEFSPRILTRFLDDQFQQWVLATILASAIYTVVVLRDIPAEGASTDVPQIAVLGAVTLAVGSVVGILLTVHVSVRDLEVGRVVRYLSDRLTHTIAERYPSVAELTPADPGAPAQPGAVIGAPESGWIRSIDDDQLLDALPPGGTVRLDQRVGEFAVARNPLATVWPADALTDERRTALLRAIEIGRTRAPLEDLEFGLRQIVDVGESSLASTSPDSSTAYEVIVHLGSVLCALYHEDEPPTAHRDDRDARVLRPHELSQDALMATAVGRLRMAGARYPLVAIYLLGMLDTLQQEVNRSGQPERLEAIRRQAALVVMGCEDGGALGPDIQLVRDKAREYGFPLVLDEDDAPTAVS